VGDSDNPITYLSAFSLNISLQTREHLGMLVPGNSLWHGAMPPLPRWSWFDKCIPNRAAPFRGTTSGPGDSTVPWALHCTRARCSCAASCPRHPAWGSLRGDCPLPCHTGQASQILIQMQWCSAL